MKNPSLSLPAFLLAFLLSSVFFAGASALAQETEKYPNFSGIYPHLAYFNKEGECGTGAVVPWAGKLWAITYGPHSPFGSSDKLYEISPDKTLTIRPESIGGTHANRMIHRESNQLFIGCYVIDSSGNVRAIHSREMPGRLTGNARHLVDPARKIYVATMEEGFYEVDVDTLKVTTLYPDPHIKAKVSNYKDILPGYHGKGFYTAQGRVVYANNGEQSPEAMRSPETTSGCLASWDGNEWSVVLRNQFTEVTGPGGIYGNDSPNDLLWSVGWDYRSVILMVLEDGAWTKYRLPKASHCYDGAHGWNTEWPRIREINEGDNYLMTMHGTFWKFPNKFSPKNAAGIRPRSTYLKVIGDFCYWNGKIAAGCDDTAKSEFLNKSPFKGTLAEPGQSNSNIWFFDPSLLDRLGTPIGRGAVWFEESVDANTPSDPYLFTGYDLRGAHLYHDLGEAVQFTFEVDPLGDGTWETLKTVVVEDAAWVEFPAEQKGEWIRVKSDKKLPKAGCFFQYKNRDARPLENNAKFAGLAAPDAKDFVGGLLWVRSDNQRLAFVAQQVEAGVVKSEKYYELSGDAELLPFDPSQDHGGGEDGTIARIKAKVGMEPLPETLYTVDEMSVLCTIYGKRYRLPIGCDEVVRTPKPLPMRLDREVATERDLFHCAGIFYELPAMNAGGLPKIRPVARDGRMITDYASYRGMMVLAGIDAEALSKNDNPHIVRSADGNAALWLGAIDDLWSFGKAVGHGAFWRETSVEQGVKSDPFLITGFDKKTLRLTNHSDAPVEVTLEIDVTATGVWKTYTTLSVGAGETVVHTFPDAFQAYWLRGSCDKDARMSAEIQFE
ncbi:MAG: hypothetical protein Q4D38_08215 [Planctomycetia bacterium]|nr:hypothetical protein [Planctomycetia bacterium]